MASYIDDYLLEKQKREDSIGMPQKQDPEEAFLTQAPLQKAEQPISYGQDPSAQGSQVASSAMQGAAAAGPMGAGIAAGGSLITSYLAQKAADERARREREQQLISKHTDDENQGFNSQLRALQGALR